MVAGHQTGVVHLLGGDEAMSASLEDAAEPLQFRGRPLGYGLVFKGERYETITNTNIGKGVLV